MDKLVKRTALLAASALMALSLSACAAQGEPQEESEAPDEAAIQALDEQTRAEIESEMELAAAAEYSNVTFSQETKTSVMSMSDNRVQEQSTSTSMKGELSMAEDDRAMHIAYEESSTMALGKTKYDMYIDPDNLIVSQGDMLYVNALDDEGFDGYASSVMAIASAEEASSMLDMASSYKIEDENGDKAITITVDVDKLMEEQMVDTSSLPEGNSVATLVVNYVIDPDHHFKTVRIMSSTSGSPTYHVSQTYRYSNYDSTTLPEWPDLNAYILEQSGIQTDENGNMFIMDESGSVQYIDRIDDDGMIYFNGTDATSGGEAIEYTSYGSEPEPVQEIDATQNEDGESGDGSGTDSDQGRAYITAYDGTIHYLDEPGSEIRDLGGATVFIDADGEWYFLNMGDEDE